MSAPLVTAASNASYFQSARVACQKATGQPLATWAVVALLNYLAQMVFRREMAPGEFGTMNTSLGLISLLTVPLAAVNLAFTHYPGHGHEKSAGTTPKK